MPIRFSCPHCGQKLSIAQGKAVTAADCPRCKRTITIPDLPPVPGAPASESVATLSGDWPSFLPDAGESDSIELFYDAPRSDDAPRAPPTTADTIVVPRRVIYLQGGLLGAVALVAFAIGVIMGSTFMARPASPPHACQITGAVMYVLGPRRRPDVGAVVILLPQSPKPPETKVPVAGLRPVDPAPPPDAEGITTLRRLGGAYARADANGRFELEIPSQGRYLVLAISNERRSTAFKNAPASDIAKLAPFFDSPIALLAGRRYKIMAELIGSDRDLNVEFD